MDDRTMEGTAPCVRWRKAEAEEVNIAERNQFCSNDFAAKYGTASPGRQKQRAT